MKYGYLNYRKHFLTNKNERPMNLGDPIQSFAVLELYRKLGILEEQMIPLDRYDLADYDGEDVVLIINGAENYEHFAYHTRFLPLSKKIHPVFLSLHLHRELSDKEMGSLRMNQPIGCRDEYTLGYLRSKGIDAFLSGCLTMLFPTRPEGQYNKIFIVDCSNNALAHIPSEIKGNAEFLSQVIRMKSDADDHRLTIEETEQFNDMARIQLQRYRDEAKLVITSRLHVASPCAAMGIPVVLVRDIFDERYQFIDRFLPLYYPADLEQLDWEHVKIANLDVIKEKLTDIGRTMLSTVVLRKELGDIYSKKFQEISFLGEEAVSVEKLPMDTNEKFEYCIWGVCMPNSYLLYEQMQNQYPNARMRYAIDTYATGIYKDNLKIIHPDEISRLVDKNTWILVVAPAAHNAAQAKLGSEYPFALLKGVECKIYTPS